MTVADVMDDEPVAIPATATVEHAFEEFFLRYGWQWFPVVDTSGRLVGLVPRKAVDDVDFERRPSTRIEEVMAHARGDELEAITVPTDAPLERLFASNALARLGAVLAIDAQGYLRGVVTAEDLRRALRGLVAPALA
ncbi:MAG: CBS domain-containing protein [Thermoleophilum sp.]|nr:CBS domain-containing protein [Thermoleophilum sp.]